MKVRLKVSIASAEWSYGPGDVAEFDDVMAKNFIMAGHAEPIEPPKEGGKDEIKNNNPSSSGAIDADGGKTTPKNKRNR